MKNKVLFIGPIKDNGGSGRKNQLFLERFQELFDEVITIDTAYWHKHPWCIFLILWDILYYKDAKIIISASSSMRYLLNFIYYFHLKREVYCWVVGGSHVKYIKEGVYNIRTQQKIKKIIVQGKSMVKELNELGLNNVVYVPNSKPIYTIQKNVTLDKTFTKFVFLSRIHPDKGIKEIVDACRILNSKGLVDKYRVDLYGAIDKSYNEEFFNLITTCDNVFYKGFLNLTSITGYEQLAKYDVMLFPTYWDGEGFPGVVLDAYMAGLPIIATDWNLNKEVIIEDKTGLLIPIHDAQALSARMQQILDREIKIEEMQKNCLQYVKQFDYKKVLSKELMKELELL